MSDIAKCTDKDCPARAHCYRYRAKTHEYRQAYGPWKHKGERCEMYQSLNGWEERHLDSMEELEGEKNEIAKRNL